MREELGPREFHPGRPVQVGQRGCSEDDPSLSPRSEYLSAPLQCAGAAPPTAGAVLPVQRLADHAALLPERALDRLPSQGPDLSGTGEWCGGQAAETHAAPDPFPVLSDTSALTLLSSSAAEASGDLVLHREGTLQAPGSELPSPAGSQSANSLCFFHPR